MVTRREGEGFFRCVCGNSWQTVSADRHMHWFTKNKQSQLAASIISCCNHICGSCFLSSVWICQASLHQCPEQYRNTPRACSSPLVTAWEAARSYASCSCPLLRFVDAISLFSGARCWRQIGSFVSRRHGCIVLQAWILQPAPVAWSNNDTHFWILFFNERNIIWKKK